MKNAALLISSLFFTYILLEFVFIPILLIAPSMQLQSNFPSIMQVMAQSSKDGLRPANYILIVGDSYAQGAGDWMLDSDPTGRPAFHAAHVLHDLTGRDVISFGRSGLDNVRGFASYPRVRQYAMKRFAVADPEIVLAYFYEGNDLADNFRFLQQRVPEYANDPGAVESIIHSKFEVVPVYEGWVQNLYVPNYVSKLVKAASTKIRSVPSDVIAFGLDAPVRKTNRFDVGGATVCPPDRLQGPALELTDEEIGWSLNLLERALKSLRDLYPEAEIHVVYVPSPLSCYSITSDTVSTENTIAERASEYGADLVQTRSLDIRARVQAIAEKLTLGFIDFTEAARKITGTTVIHGPKDWKHFNRTGYTQLGETIAAGLDDKPPKGQ